MTSVTLVDTARPLGLSRSSRGRSSERATCRWRSADGGWRRSLRGAPPLREGSSVLVFPAPDLASDEPSSALAAVVPLTGTVRPSDSLGHLLVAPDRLVASEPFDRFERLSAYRALRIHAASIYPRVDIVKVLHSKDGAFVSGPRVVFLNDQPYKDGQENPLIALGDTLAFSALQIDEEVR